MKFNLIRRMLPQVIALSAMTSAFAENDLCPSPPPPPPPQKPACITDQTQSIIRPPVREITPSAGPRVVCGADFSISADFIWWRTHEDGLAYVQSAQSKLVTNPSRGNVLHPQFDWEPGFKVGLGLNISRDGWDIFAQYTWLQSHSNRSSTEQNPSTTTLFPTWIIDPLVALSTLNNFFRATGDWDLHFNVIDLELGRNFFISQYLSLRPHIGLKGTWQHQDYDVTYRYFTPLINDDIIVQKMRQDQNYWGIGIRTGLDTAWHFARSFSLFCNWALTALWTDFDIKRKDTSEDLGPTTPVPERITLQTRNDMHSLKPLLEFIIGLRYETWWNDDNYHFSLEAGWEEQIWWSFNQLIKFNEESAHGDLTLHGLTIKARFDF